MTAGFGIAPDCDLKLTSNSIRRRTLPSEQPAYRKRAQAIVPFDDGAAAPRIVGLVDNYLRLRQQQQFTSVLDCAPYWAIFEILLSIVGIMTWARFLPLPPRNTL
jgi:hypothetical protein